MSALTITVMTLSASSAIAAIVEDRIYAGNPPQDATYPNIGVHLIYNGDEMLLAGAAEFPEARVTIDCRSRSLPEADTLAEIAIAWLQSKHLYTVDNSVASFRKEGTDETEQANSTGGGGLQDVSRRFFDFYVQHRAV
jgi:hypothetical protein